jgi:murein DD-endopeptidase MepM/ murein hydrolase activator NlpD
MRRTIVTIVFFCGIIQSLCAQQQGSERFSRIINRLMEAMNSQDYNAIVREYDKGMSVAFPLFKTTYFFKNNYDTFGKILKVDPPLVRATDQAVCVMYAERGIQDLTIYIDDQDKIKGFLFTTHTASETQPTPAVSNVASTSSPTPASANPPVQKPVAESTPAPQPAAPVVRDKQQTELFLPFTGTWTIIGSGDGTGQRNLLQQQYTYEFSSTDASGRRYKTDGKTNDDYLVYGREVLAPANGTVVEVIDGVRENSPGIRNPYALIGNAIIIQHSDKEYSVLAYLKPGSIRVKAGDKIIRGQTLAQCGNSGNANEPALHFHLQDSPYLQIAKSLKFYFERALVTKEGKKQLQLIHLPEVGEALSPE